MKLKPDPFSRDLKKVAKKLQAQPAMDVQAALDQVAEDHYEPEPEYDDESMADMMELATPAPSTQPSNSLGAAAAQVYNYAMMDTNNPFASGDWDV
jgi:hypothetical protein